VVSLMIRANMPFLFLIKGEKMVNKIIGKLIDKMISKKIGLSTNTVVENCKVISAAENSEENNYSYVCVNLRIKVKNDELLAMVDRMK